MSAGQVTCVFLTMQQLQRDVSVETSQPAGPWSVGSLVLGRV